MNKNGKLIALGIFFILIGAISQILISFFQMGSEINTIWVIIGFLPILLASTLIAQYLAELNQTNNIRLKLSLPLFLAGVGLMMLIYLLEPMLIDLFMPPLIIISFLFVDSLAVSYVGILIPIFIQHKQTNR